MDVGACDSPRRTTETDVSRGEILKTQNRLGHADPHTTLRSYSHALPLHDQEVADLLDDLYRT